VTKERLYDLSGIGSMAVDAIHRVPRPARQDEKVLLLPDSDGTVIRRLVGGVALNHLGWARILGLRVAVFGKQADDADGRILRQGMARLGMDVQLDLSGRTSSFSEVYVDPAGARSIYMSRGATADVTAEEVDAVHRKVIAQSAIVSTEVSQLPLPAVRRVLEIAREVGARTVLDLDVPLEDAVPALGTRTEFNAVLGLADILKPSLGATPGLTSSVDPRDVAREMEQRFGSETIVITTGEAGCIVRTGGTTLEVPTCSVDVVDTTGAGDAFLGGLVAGLHYGLDWETAARLGNASGACCCGQLGAFPAEPESRERVLELYGRLGGSPFSPRSVPVLQTSEFDPVGSFLAAAARECDRIATSMDRNTLEQAARLILEAEAKGGRLHITGVGKPESVARYAAGILSSTGTPAIFLSATDALHGSVGQVREGDVLIAISNSGETEEVLACTRVAREMGSRTIGVCGSASAPLSRLSDVLILAGVTEEGGPLGLAPRASFLAEALALQALSVLLQEKKRFTAAEYRRRHPAGALGRRASKLSGSDPEGD
jgi:arabinose-5-phosphate isomerase